MGSSWSSPITKEVLVHFNGKKLRVVFSAEDYNGDMQIPLQKFRTKLAKSLAVPATSLQLYELNPQRLLKNLGVTLESYGLKNGSELLAVQDVPKQAKTENAPVSVSEKVMQVLDSLESELGDRMRAFETSPPADLEAREKEHRILAETILTKLISLDNIEIEYPTDRALRKQAISRLHQYHSDVDAVMKKSSELEKSEEAETQPTVTSTSATPAGAPAPIPEAVPLLEADPETAASRPKSKKKSGRSKKGRK